mmetsp:Transcript_27413/g.78994  ORF Transcript_27413/g.78994 Transcript_27413/m.78994 type:complete len:467 (-) Transcript_27413:78-1478(-)|eukprot:CAMPEP_0176099536 /NCGR_PEP_ID=MMETSP0120_2-20121206/49917_1 /TAXON_ID=160619 /ORGANISM="Kryptoperidinium foliaceum, Strain CCMP 1326" /LENGTH=466 /DNA_ID=CAMNT_0017433567 /DNA_START=141 /DNA_END=1541 /DNA_ORIENTATION=-
MPLYEEKLISPLAVRFTQEHIKTIFRDGHVVEETAAEIKAGAGVGDFDIVLRAPFPAIEIIRWHAPGTKDSDRHWFTLDNRRLYTLQRAAALFWPKRVGAVVEILYADPGSVNRKYDSTTFGRTVTVSHSCKEAALFRWDWRSEVANAKFVRPAMETKDDKPAWDGVIADDQKDAVDDLADVSGESDVSCVVARACEAMAAHDALAARAAQGPVSSSSTATPSEDGEDTEDRRSITVASDEADQGTGWARRPAARRNAAATGELAERAVAEIVAQLKRDGDGHVRVPRWADRYGARLGGMGMRLFLEKHPETFQVVSDKSGKWLVKLVGDDATSRTSATAPSTDSARATAPTAAIATKGGSNGVVERGIAEIAAQLEPSGVPSYVHIPDWNRRFARHLGQLRTFAESRPDKFVVVSCGKGFRVAPADGAWAAQRGALAVQMAMQKLQVESMMAGARYLAAQAAAYR